MASGISGNHWTAGIRDVIWDYNHSRHSTIKMKPVEALGVLDDASATPAQKQAYRDAIHARVIANTKLAGERSLKRAAKEDRAKLPALEVGDCVLVAAPGHRKIHSTARGYRLLLVSVAVASSVLLHA